MAPGSLPGSQYAMRVFHPGPPILRVRYRQGVLVGPEGAPDWLLYARALVRWQPVPDRTLDELRVAYLLAANLRMARDGDPLWDGTGSEPAAAATPPGWTWAQLADAPQCALVPVELHAAYRHFGGVTTLLRDLPRGLRTDPGAPEVEFEAMGTVAGDALDELGEHLGYPLPPKYREFLAATNGAVPLGPYLCDGFGFVVDQPFFGLARNDRLQELWYVNGWLRDRLTARYLAIGYVQGGLLAVRLDGPDRDSVWYWDDDDPRAEEGHDAEYICANLLYRVADDVEQFWSALRGPPDTVCQQAAGLVESGQVVAVAHRLAGTALPAARRAPGQPTTEPRGQDPLVARFELR